MLRTTTRKSYKSTVIGENAPSKLWRTASILGIGEVGRFELYPYHVTIKPDETPSIVANRVAVENGCDVELTIID